MDVWDIDDRASCRCQGKQGSLRREVYGVAPKVKRIVNQSVVWQWYAVYRALTKNSRFNLYVVDSGKQSTDPDDTGCRVA